MRVVTTAGTVVALLGALLQAPFLHIHPGTIDHPPMSPLHFHSHVEASVPGPIIGAHTPDENEIDLAWHICAQSQPGLPLDLPATEIAIVSPPTSARMATSIPRPRGHDPPDVAPKSPRAPPA